MKQASDMKSEPVFCKPDTTGEVIKFVCDGLKDTADDYLPCLAVGIYQKELIGGVLIHDIREKRDCFLTIYTTTPKWAKRHVLKYVFGIVFKLIEAERCSVLVSESNKKSLDMCLRLGFEKEGLLRRYRENGEDCYILGMLKQDCKWSK